MYDPAQPTAAETAAGFTDGDDFEYHRALQSFGDDAVAGQLLSRQRSRFHVRLVCRRRDRANPDTLESGATATWTTSALAAGTYTVYADYSLTDQDGNARDSPIARLNTRSLYPGGSQTVTIDQGTAVNGQLDLGSDYHHRPRPDSSRIDARRRRRRQTNGRWPIRSSSWRRASI